jgi:hypothetical protein
MMKYADQFTRPEQRPGLSFNIKRDVIPVPPLWPEKPALWDRAAGGSVCFVQHQAGRDNVLLRNITT